MAASFFFYDLETSGFDPKKTRIMQFAGQRTDMDLNPVGEPVNVLIKLTPDVLPDPEAILITGITPQQTLADGLTEAEFVKFFCDEVVTKDTIFIGFNSVRFDDEFMRYLLYRNFYDPYEWHWKDGCSRWDLLDVVRMTRALRPEGIEWPFASDGKPANRLEYLTKVNNLDHYRAHDALSDVHATIAVARLIQEKQPDLFDYLLKGRGKKSVAELVGQKQPFVYTSGRFPSATLHTTAAVLLGSHTSRDEALVYDLRYDPTPFAKMSVDEIIKAWQWSRDPDAVRLPVKTIKYNRCPAVAPLGVIKDKAAQERIDLSLEAVSQNLARLKDCQEELAAKVQQAVEKMDKAREQDQTALVDDELTVDARLYDGFPSDADRNAMRAVRAAKPEELGGMVDSFEDSRYRLLLPLYKARNYPQSLTGEERQAWDEFIYKKLMGGGTESRLAQYMNRLQELAAGKLSGEQQYLLEELQLYAESIVPADVAG
jgi:exodeoxyribonuclease-1